jgi:hypothetical protein
MVSPDLLNSCSSSGWSCGAAGLPSLAWTATTVTCTEEHVTRGVAGDQTGRPREPCIRKTTTTLASHHDLDGCGQF